MVDPSKTLVIANPMARNGFVGENWPALSARIREALGAVDLQLTESRGDGLRIGKEAIAKGVRTRFLTCETSSLFWRAIAPPVTVR